MCGESQVLETGRSYHAIGLTGTLADVASADTVVAGIEDPGRPEAVPACCGMPPFAVREFAPICPGAFELAAAGLLDGLKKRLEVEGRAW